MCTGMYICEFYKCNLFLYSKLQIICAIVFDRRLLEASEF